MNDADILIMRGPNQWSVNYHQLAVLHYKKEDIPVPAEQFFEALKKIFPDADILSMQSMELPYILGTVALELQKEQGLRQDFLEVHDIPQANACKIIFSYLNEKTGRYSAHAAYTMVKTIIEGQDYDPWVARVEMAELARNRQGPTSAFLEEEIKKRNIPCTRSSYGSLITVGYGLKQKKIRTAVADTTSGIGIEIAGDKEETKQLLKEKGIPVPKGLVLYSEEELRESLTELSYPLVIKPLDGNHGRGVTTNINDPEKAVFGFRNAQKISRPVIIEEFIEGDDHRMLVINFKLVAVARRTPARITGDGASTIQQLIDKTNEDPMRGDTDRHVMARIVVDDITKNILRDKKLKTSSILPKGEVLVLKDTANISAGGTADDVTESVHPENVFLAERIARIFNLDICGIDMLTTDISVPLRQTKGAVIEVNAGPGLRMHTDPSSGTPRNVAKPIIDMLFPDKDFMIPVIAITGTNGKTTVTRLIAHLVREAGYKPGYTTSEGIYILGHLIEEGDCTGFRSARTVLYDPSIDIAVLECARGGIIRNGLGFDKCDISVIMNVTDDHLGLDDIYTVEEMARVKMVLAKSTKAEGYAVLNADDDLVYNMQAEIRCKVALFSMQENSERIRLHCETGGIAAILKNGVIMLCQGRWEIPIGKAADIPLSLNGRAECMIQNILAATLAVAILTDFNSGTIKMGLASFIPSPELTPGRFNIFKFGDVELLVDYAHNTDGLSQLKKFLAKTDAAEKTGIIAATGDRRDEDLRTQGMLSAEMYDRIIIRYDDDNRGRSKEDIYKLLMEGIRSVDPSKPVEVIEDEKGSIEYAISKAKKGSLIVTRADHVLETISMVKDLQEEMKLAH